MCIYGCTLTISLTPSCAALAVALLMAICCAASAALGTITSSSLVAVSPALIVVPLNVAPSKSASVLTCLLSKFSRAFGFLYVFCIQVNSFNTGRNSVCKSVNSWELCWKIASGLGRAEFSHPTLACWCGCRRRLNPNARGLGFKHPSRLSSRS